MTRLYKAYPLDAAGRFVGAATEFPAEDDLSAIKQARRLVDGNNLEVWDGSRRVDRVPHSLPKR